jgi:hypothetical protein
MYQTMNGAVIDDHQDYDTCSDIAPLSCEKVDYQLELSNISSKLNDLTLKMSLLDEFIRKSSHNHRMDWALSNVGMFEANHGPEFVSVLHDILKAFRQDMEWIIDIRAAILPGMFVFHTR